MCVVTRQPTKEGSIYIARHGENIHKRKDGRWEARLKEHFEDGTAQYRYFYGKSYAEVKAKRDEFVVGIGVLKPPPAKKMATLEWLAFDWMNKIRGSVKESTLTRYNRSIQRYILPALVKTAVNTLDLTVINMFVDDLIQKLAPKTVNDILSVLKQIIKYGNASSYYSIDVKSINSPKRKPPDIKIVSEPNRVDLEKVLWNSNNDICVGILLTLYTGIRNGELCGLRWGDINFKDKTVRISRTIERIAELDPLSASKTKVIICEPKTEYSRRVIPLPGFLSEFLLSHRKSNDLYIVTGTDKPSEPHTVYIRYTRFLKRNGIDNYTFHALRHTFATCCVEAGFDTKSLSEILGHSNVTTTFRKDYLLKIGSFDDIDVGDEFYLMLKAINGKGKFCYYPACDVKAYIHTGESGLSSGSGKIDGENRLFRYKEKYFAQLSKSDIRYIKMRHYAVLAFAYLRMKKWGPFISNVAHSFFSTPAGCVKLVMGRKGI